MKLGIVVIQEAQRESNTVCRNLRYFTLTGDEGFYHVLNVFMCIFFVSVVYAYGVVGYILYDTIRYEMLF